MIRFVNNLTDFGYYEIFIVQKVNNLLIINIYVSKVFSRDSILITSAMSWQISFAMFLNLANFLLQVCARIVSGRPTENC